GTRWVETQNLIASDGEAGDEFGGSLALAGSMAVSGATNDGFSDIPAAYVYELVTDELVEVDVKPRRATNRIDLAARGVVRVAICGSDELDVSEIDLSTLQFGPNGAPPLPNSDRKRILDRDLLDVDGDARTDLVRRFRISALGLELGDTEACIRGRLLDGTAFDGCDRIQTVISSDPRD
ncbi:MAG TPA: FG-GAP repeat protein, partial [Myxococcota bacterium]|nr:FG-GAP repeat protein [Myxococcota bacterium]